MVFEFKGQPYLRAGLFSAFLGIQVVSKAAWNIGLFDQKLEN